MKIIVFNDPISGDYVVKFIDELGDEYEGRSELLSEAVYLVADEIAYTGR